MHELSIAQALVEQIAAAARDVDNAPVTSARVIVGGLSGVDAEALRVVFPIATDGTAFSETTLMTEEDPAVIACRHCGARTTPEFPLPICAACESTDVTIEGGQNLLLASIEIDV